MARNDEKKSIRCSFCGKHQEQVHRLIAGPGVYICNECVAAVHEHPGDEGFAEEGHARRRSRTSMPYARGDPCTCWTSISSARTQAKVALSVAVYNHYKRIYFGGGRRCGAAEEQHPADRAPPAAARPCLPRPWPRC